jgi:hypothetical protein
MSQVIAAGISDVERLGLRALTQELEDGERTRASVSRELSGGTSLGGALVEPDLGSRLAAVLDGQDTRMASQLGPWDTGYFTFSGGVAVGGYANLTLHQNGAINFSGHFHVSGAISYNTSFVWAVRDSNNPATVYAFAHNGRVHGTFEAGSRDDDWGRSEIQPAVAAGWAALDRAWSFRWEARVNADFGVFLDDIVRLVAAGQAIGNVVKIFI